MPLFSTTGTEAMFADLGQYTAASIRVCKPTVKEDSMHLMLLGWHNLVIRTFGAKNILRLSFSPLWKEGNLIHKRITRIFYNCSLLDQIMVW